jgi:uncharacterized protein (TIGR03437 family)
MVRPADGLLESAMRLPKVTGLLCVTNVLFGATPIVNVVANSASFATGTVAPGSVATIFGSGLAAATAVPTGFPLPSSLGNASVYVGGVAAPLLYVSPEQINFQVPWETPLGQTSVVMIVDSVTSNQLSVQVAPAAPGIFLGGILVSAPSQRANRSDGRAARGGEYITILATGLGAVSNQPNTGAAPSETTLSNLKSTPVVTIGGSAAVVSFAGLAPPGPNPYTAGVYQINALVPTNLPAGDSISVIVSLGDVRSNSVNVSIDNGRSDSIAKFVELGPAGAVIARAITSENTCPSIVLDGASQLMQTRAAPTLPFYPVLTCQTQIPAGTTSVSIEGQALLLPIADPTNLTVLGDTGCRMDASASQACNDPKAWPVVQLAQNAAATNPQLLIHNGDYHYREVQCMNSGCAGSPWGYNWDVWREDLFNPFASLLATAPWVFVRGNHETCDRAGEGWFRFLDPRPMPAACQTYTDPYSIDIGSIQLIHLDSAAADDSTPTPDPAIVAAYIPQFDKVGQMVGSNAWIITHRPIWAIRSNANSNVVLQAASQNFLPAGVQLVLSGHTHTFQTYTFSPQRAPQLVIGNSGDNLAANPTVPIVGAVLGDATVTQGISLSGFGFSTMTQVSGGGWAVTAIDSAGNTVANCTLQPQVITCNK